MHHHVLNIMHRALEGESEEEEAWEEIDDDFVSQANKGNFDYGPSTRTVRFGGEHTLPT